jgi:hypothetical protein
MILHAIFEGVHAALIHSPCLPWSLMLDERLAQSSHCIIITFSIAFYRCLFFHKFSSLSISDHVENNSFHAWCMKLSFHQVFIHLQRTPIEWVMPVLLRRCNLSKADFRQHIAQCFLPYLLVQVLKFIDLGCVGTGTWWSFWFSTFSSLNMPDQLLKIDENSDVCFWGSVTVMHGFATP